jgi:hypothetical protein
MFIVTISKGNGTEETVEAVKEVQSIIQATAIIDMHMRLGKQYKCTVEYKRG